MLSIIFSLAGIWLAFLVIFFVVGLFLACVYHLPYYVWLSFQNDKGLHLDLVHVSYGRQIINTAKWWKSIFTHKPAF